MDVLKYVRHRANFSTLLLGLGTVLAGTASAALRGNMEVLPAFVCCLFVVFAQLSANFMHHYYTAEKFYDNQPKPRYTIIEELPVRNKLEVRILREASFSCGVIAGMVGLTILGMSESPWLALLVAAIVVGVNWILNFGKNPQFGKPWTLLCTWLLFGPVGVIFTSLFQSQHEALHIWNFYDYGPSLFMGMAMGLMACNVHLMFGYSMYRLNPRREARGVTYKWGPRPVEWLMFINGLVALGVLVFMAFFLDIMNPEICLVPAVIAFMFNTFICIRMRYVPVGELQLLNMMAKVNYFVFGLLSLIFWYMIDMPDDSVKVLF